MIEIRYASSLHGVTMNLILRTTVVYGHFRQLLSLQTALLYSSYRSSPFLGPFFVIPSTRDLTSEIQK